MEQEKRNIQVDLESAKEWYNSNDAFKKELALKAFKEEELKTLTYEDIAKELFLYKETYYVNAGGGISIFTPSHDDAIVVANNATSKKQCEKLLAINKMMNIAKYLNGDEPFDYCIVYAFYVGPYTNELKILKTIGGFADVPFRTREIAEEALEILGEDTIRTALTLNY